MTGFQLNSSIRNDLLNLGLLTLELSEHDHVTMTELLDYIIANPVARNVTSLLVNVKAHLDAKYASLDVWQALFFLREYIRVEGHGIARGSASLMLIFVLVTGVFVAMRLWLKKFILRNGFKRDDILIGLAWLGALLYTSCAWYNQAKPRVGRHIWDLSKYDITDALMSMFASELLYDVIITLVKLAVLAFYSEIVPRSEGTKAFKRFHLYLTIAAVFTIAHGLTAILVVTFQCKPVDFWNNPVDAECLPRRELWVYGGVVNIVSDTIILLLAIKVISSLKLRLRDKIIAIGLFSLGILSCAAGIPRVVKTDLWVEDPDNTSGSEELIIWVQLEFCLPLLAITIPSVRCLVARYAPKLMMWRGKNESATGSNASSTRVLTRKDEMVVVQTTSAQEDRSINNVEGQGSRRTLNAPGFMAGSVGSDAEALI